MSQPEANKQRMCILFTGNGERMIDNVVALLPESYDVRRCQPTETEFILALKKLRPHVILVCLQNETRDLLRVYDILCTDPAYSSRPVIAVGYEDDCVLFRSRIPIKNLQTFPRPLNREALLRALEEFTALAEQEFGATAQGDATPDADAAPDNLLVDEIALDESEQALVRRIQRQTRIHGRKTVLVVDDDVRMLNIIKLYLQDLYDVTVVPSGKLALKFISKKVPDLVLLDYMMPELDGPEVLRYIRKESNCPDVPVIFLTGVSDKESVLHCLEYRPNGYLLKPVARELLLEKVTEAILGL